jgi:hypothetical protein
MTAFTPRSLRGDYFGTHVPRPQALLAHFHTAPRAVTFRICTLYAVVCEVRSSVLDGKNPTVAARCQMSDSPLAKQFVAHRKSNVR